MVVMMIVQVKMIVLQHIGKVGVVQRVRHHSCPLNKRRRHCIDNSVGDEDLMTMREMRKVMRW